MTLTFNLHGQRHTVYSYTYTFKKCVILISWLGNTDKDFMYMYTSTMYVTVDIQKFIHCIAYLPLACIANRACKNGEWVNVLRSFSLSRADVVYGYVLTVFTIYYYTEADKQKLTTEFIINMHDFLIHNESAKISPCNSPPSRLHFTFMVDTVHCTVP